MLLRFLWWEWNRVQCSIIIYNNDLPTTEARLICVNQPLPSIPHDQDGVQSIIKNKHYFWPQMGAEHCYLLPFWVALPLVSSSSSHAWTYQLNDYSKEHFSGVSSRGSLSSLVLCLENSSCPVLCVSALASQSRVFFGVHFPALCPTNYLKAVSWDNDRTHFVFCLT